MKYNNIKLLEIGSRTNYTTIDWILGNYCNYKCDYCFPMLNSGTIRPPKLDSELKDNILHLINQVKTVTDKKLLFNFAGGEPTLYHDFENLLTYVKEYGYVSVITNGSRTANWWEGNKKFLDKVIISYHVEQANLEHIKNIIRILENNVSLSIHVMVDDLHFDKSIHAFNEFQKFILQEQLKVNLLVKPLRSTTTRKIVYTENYLNIISNLRTITKNPNHFFNSYSTVKLENGEETIFNIKDVLRLQGNYKNYKCYAPSNFVQILSDGKIGEMTCGQKYLPEATNIFALDFKEKFILKNDHIICQSTNKCGCVGLELANKILL